MSDSDEEPWDTFEDMKRSGAYLVLECDKCELEATPYNLQEYCEDLKDQHHWCAVVFDRCRTLTYDGKVAQRWTLDLKPFWTEEEMDT